MSLNKMESASSSPLPPPSQQQIKEEEQDIADEVPDVSSLISSSLRTVHDTEDEEPRLQSAAPPISDLPLSHSPDGANNSNSNNSCCTPPLQASEPEGWHSQHPPTEPSTAPDPPKKRTKGGGKHGNVEVTLEGKTLWDEFYCRGTEMIVNRSGRCVVIMELQILIWSLMHVCKSVMQFTPVKKAIICITSYTLTHTHTHTHTLTHPHTHTHTHTQENVSWVLCCYLWPQAQSQVYNEAGGGAGRQPSLQVPQCKVEATNWICG